MNKFAIATTLALLAVTAQAQDLAAGKAAFAQCSACHSVDGSNGAGPSLQGIGGRKAGSFPGFRFSRAMKGAGFNWDEKALAAYLADPQKVVPGNVMPFSGVAECAAKYSKMVKVGTAKMLFSFINRMVSSLSWSAWSMDATPACAAKSVPGSPVACTATRLPRRAASLTAASSCGSVYW